MKATPADAGCWVEGRWGQYAMAHLVQKAEGYGYADPEVISLADRKINEMGPSADKQAAARLILAAERQGFDDAAAIAWARAHTPLTYDEYEALINASDEVESWLNENIAPDGYTFGWHDGEFFLWSDETWEEVC